MSKALWSRIEVILNSNELGELTPSTVQSEFTSASFIKNMHVVIGLQMPMEVLTLDQNLNVFSHPNLAPVLTRSVNW